jgi:glycogen debranching enzyme
LDEVIRVKDQYYILSTSSLADDRTRVLKHGDTFAVYDRRGDIEPLGKGTQGLYHREARYLSLWVLRLDHDRPLLLSSTVREDNASTATDLTNPDFYKEGGVIVPRGTLYISRSKFLWEGSHYEQFHIVNYSLSSVDLTFSIQFAADFADIFEIRGIKRAKRGRLLPEELEEDHVVLSYEGLDGIIRRTVIHCTPKPHRITPSEIFLSASLQPKESRHFFVTVSCHSSRNGSPSRISFDAAVQKSTQELRQAEASICRIYTSNEQFNDWLNRSAADLLMMITQTPYGPYPYAGVPWFSTAFGRDGIITALETLWVNPGIARGVLAYLAAHQANEVDYESDAEPGKILHETRQGEMAALKEVPFGCYYGSVDATPLFVMLAGAYYRRTGDLPFIKAIWPNILKALEWIDRYGDMDHDGFVEYSRRSPKGLVHQGWKDSNDSIFHSDGELAEGPIALCEVQGYVYAAKRRAARLAAALGFDEQAGILQAQARTLRVRFEKAFWCEDLGTYALALDGKKQPCRVRTSNAGHCLHTGIANYEHAEQVTRALLSEDFYSGWGIRTVSAREVRYNPMSYHNGSVWPHDNALIAQGMARYGFHEAAARILNGLFDASIFMDSHRLPELFCGFPRQPAQGPTLYPVACSPQAWAAASVFMILEACLDITIRGHRPLVLFRKTFLPQSLHRIEMRGLQVGEATVDLAVHRVGEGIEVNVLRKQGEVQIVSVK